MKTLIKLLTLTGSTLTLMTGCNSGTTNTPDTPSTLLNTVHDNQIYFGGSCSNDGKSPAVCKIDPIEYPAPRGSVLFEEIDHQVNDAWKGITVQRNNSGTNDIHFTSLNIKAGRTGSKDTAHWITANGFLLNSQKKPDHGQSSMYNIKYSSLPDNYNFAIRGNFMFKYRPNSTEYICNNIAITQYKPNWYSDNQWSVFSNIAPYFSVDVARPNDSITINCINQSNKQVEPFKISVIPNSWTDPVNQFNIDKIIESNNSNYTEKEFKQQILNSFNGMSLRAKIAILANSFDLTKLNLHTLWGNLTSDADDLHIEAIPHKNEAILSSPPIILNKRPIIVESHTIYNCSDKSELLASRKFSAVRKEIVTTTTEHSFNDKLASILPTSDGTLVIDNVAGKIINTTFKYGNHSVTISNESIHEIPSENVLVAPRSKRTITASLDQIKYSGTYKFMVPFKGTLRIDTFLFDTNSNYLPVWLFNSAEGNFSSTINLYSTINVNRSSLNPMIQLDTNTKEVLLVGNGSYSGETVSSKADFTTTLDTPLTEEELKYECDINNGDASPL